MNLGKQNTVEICGMIVKRSRTVTLVLMQNTFRSSPAPDTPRDVRLTCHQHWSSHRTTDENDLLSSNSILKMLCFTLNHQGLVWVISLFTELYILTNQELFLRKIWLGLHSMSDSLIRKARSTDLTLYWRIIG